MDNESRRRLEPLSPGQLVALFLAILALAALVVSASQPGGVGPAAPPSSAQTGAAVIRAAVILFAIGEACVLGLIVWALWPSGRRRRIQTRRGTLAIAIASFLQSAAILVLFWYYVHYRTTVRGRDGGLFSNFGPPPAILALPAVRGSAGTGQEWLTWLLVGAVLAIAAAYVLRGLRFGKKRVSPRAKLAEQLQEALEDGLAELEAEPDPRRAIIAAYRRMELALARVGMPRARHEGALEYLDRLLSLLGADGPAARRLTELFQLAKFSDHLIDRQMQGEAIRLLGELRDDLRAPSAAPDPQGAPA